MLTPVVHIVIPSTLQDINACLTQPCHALALCTDDQPPSLGRTCACKAGYSGDGVTSCTGSSFGVIGLLVLYLMIYCSTYPPVEITNMVVSMNGNMMDETVINS